MYPLFFLYNIIVFCFGVYGYFAFQRKGGFKKKIKIKIKLK